MQTRKRSSDHLGENIDNKRIRNGKNNFPRRPRPPKKDDDDDILFIRFNIPLPPPQPPLEEIEDLPLVVPSLKDYCKNPLCDHKGFDENPNEPNIMSITEIKSINDIINLGLSYNCQKNLLYHGMNLRIFANLIGPLTELSAMVGMNGVKEQMINQILFFVQNGSMDKRCGKCVDCKFNLPCINTNKDMLHTVISGPPGVGKTELGKILGKVYKEMGILSKGTFKLASRSDLIAGYLGQTAIKTQKVIN
ncbi:MAG: hypothetical protein EBQ92_00580, partial [Proteobacteria bacterium]|nr:hypothetical protein [Pseudomonadota bacterium]